MPRSSSTHSTPHSDQRAVRRPARRATSLVALAAVTALAPLVVAAPAPAGVMFPRVSPDSAITTIVGTGAAGYEGDGGSATSATLKQPRDTAVGPDGSLYITDTFNNVVRRVDPDGVISTFAGTGEPAFGGDGGPATEAQLHWPHDVTVDDAGNVYIADSNNQRIRVVNTEGVISTIAGNGDGGYNGDDIPAVEASMRFPKSVAIFGGGLFFADSLNSRIRRVDLTSGIITTVAGSGERGFGGDGGPALEALFDIPQRIAIDDAGNLYIADTRNNRVRFVDMATGLITTVVGTGEDGYGGDNGPAVDAMISTPRGIALGGQNNLYIADSGNNCVRRVNLGNGQVYTVVGTGEPGYAGDGGRSAEALVDGPRGLSVNPDGSLVVADTKNNVIRLVMPDVAPAQK